MLYSNKLISKILFSKDTGINIGMINAVMEYL